MDQNTLGIIYSYIFIISVLIIAYILSKFNQIPSEFIRKFIHILVSNWWFIYANYFTDAFHSVIVPITFVFANAIATFTNFTDKLRLTERTRNYGLIYFPISLTILCILCHSYHVIPKYSVGIGILTMGYGDGLAAIIGKKYGKNKLKFVTGSKSVEGSLVMMITTFFIFLSFIHYYGIEPFSLNSSLKLDVLLTISVLSFIIAVTEAATPKGFDNITVPILSAFLSYYVL